LKKGALINKFHKRLISDEENATQMACKMMEKSKSANELMEFVKVKHLNRKSVFVLVKCLKKELASFPRLSLDCLKNEVTFGSYQLKHSLSYLAEHFDIYGRYQVFLFNQPLNDGTKITSIRIPSRHSSTTQYRVYLRYLPSSELNRVDFIKGMQIVSIFNQFKSR
jgi:hypothetical protein